VHPNFGDMKSSTPFSAPQQFRHRWPLRCLPRCPQQQPTSAPRARWSVNKNALCFTIITIQPNMTEPYSNCSIQAILILTRRRAKQCKVVFAEIPRSILRTHPPTTPTGQHQPHLPEHLANPNLTPLPRRRLSTVAVSLLLFGSPLL
jgi:hypothetical protein